MDLVEWRSPGRVLPYHAEYAVLSDVQSDGYYRDLQAGSPGWQLTGCWLAASMWRYNPHLKHVIANADLAVQATGTVYSGLIHNP
jgi:hypothetical protein